VSFSQRTAKREQQCANSKKQGASMYTYVRMAGKKKSFRHHERRAPDFLKKNGRKKIIMAGNERAPKK